MVCEKCEKKKDSVICPDPWKAGARNTMESGGRAVNENKLLSKNRRLAPYATKESMYGHKCKLCKCNLPENSIYCQSCSYKKGLCSMCGVKIMDTKGYKQSMT